MKKKNDYMYVEPISFFSEETRKALHLGEYADDEEEEEKEKKEKKEKKNK